MNLGKNSTGSNIELHAVVTIIARSVATRWWIGGNMAEGGDDGGVLYSCDLLPPPGQCGVHIHGVMVHGGSWFVHGGCARVPIKLEWS